MSAAQPTPAEAPATVAESGIFSILSLWLAEICSRVVCWDSSGECECRIFEVNREQILTSRSRPSPLYFLYNAMHSLVIANKLRLTSSFLSCSSENMGENKIRNSPFPRYRLDR